MLLIGLTIIALLFSFTVKNEINNECNEKENYTSARKIETRILWEPELPDGDLNGSRHFVQNFLEEEQFFSTKRSENQERWHVFCMESVSGREGFQRYSIFLHDKLYQHKKVNWKLKIISCKWTIKEKQKQKQQARQQAKSFHLEITVAVYI